MIDYYYEALRNLEKAELIHEKLMHLPGESVGKAFNHLIRGINSMISYYLGRDASLDNDYFIIHNEFPKELFELYFFIKGLTVNVSFDKLKGDTVMIKGWKNEKLITQEQLGKYIHLIKSYMNNIK